MRFASNEWSRALLGSIPAVTLIEASVVPTVEIRQGMKFAWSDEIAPGSIGDRRAVAALGEPVRRGAAAGI
jgi:hypothetical protein